MTTDSDSGQNDGEQAEYYYYLDFQGRGSLWGTGRHLMRVVEGGVYRRKKRTTSNVITKTIRVTDLDPDTGDVEYTISERNAPTRTASGVAEGMGQIRAGRGTPTAHLGTEDIPEGVSPHNRTSGWPSRPMDPEDIPEDPEREVMTDGGEEQRSGMFLGTALGMRVREPGEDADHPLLEIYGDEGMAAVEMPSEFTDGLSHAAAELDMAREDDPEAMTDGGVDTAAELMNLARHFHDEAREQRYRAGKHTSEDSELMMNQIADSNARVADELRELARYLDGERDRPAALAHGQALADGDGVPWRSSGEDGGDADE